MADNNSNDPVNDQASDRPVDRPLDEATSAADADWLATLRAKAKEKNATLAEMVADEAVEPAATTDTADTAADLGLSDLDDEPTIGSPNALEDIRQIAREERQRIAPPPAPAATPAAAPAEQIEQAERPLAPPIAVRPVASLTPNAPSAPPPPRAAPPELAAPDAVTAAGAAPRWEAPPRLEAASHVVEPASFQWNNSQRTTDWRLAALGLVAAVLLGIVITLVFFKDTPAGPVDDDPNVTTVGADTTGTVATGSVIVEPEVGS